MTGYEHMLISALRYALVCEAEVQNQFPEIVFNM